MKLLTETLRKKLPPLSATENEKDPLVICKFFLPGSHWTWYATEFDGKDTFFGWVVGDIPDLGYFTLSELEQLRAPLTICTNGKCETYKSVLQVERDLHFEPCRLSTVKKEEKEEGYYTINTQKLDELQSFVDREILDCQSLLVEKMLIDGVFNWEDVENLYKSKEELLDEGYTLEQIENGEADDHHEIYEWWLVTNWFADKLRAQSEPVLDNDYGTWWGRTGTGQAIYIDGVIGRIYDSLQSLQGKEVS